MLSKKKKIGIGVVVGLGIIGALSGGGEEVPVPDITQAVQTVAVATKPPATKPPVTKAPATKAPATKAPATATESARIYATLELMQESFATSGTVRFDKEMKLFLLTPYDTSITESAILVRDSGLLRDDWEAMKEAFAVLSETVHETLPGYGIGIVNTSNTDNLLLVLMNGVTVYDVTEE